jgi:hypothetical protein
MARPRKSILIYADNEDELGRLAYALNIAGHYAAAKASCDEQLAYLLKNAEWDLVVIMHEGDAEHTESLAFRARRSTACPVMVLDEGKGAASSFQSASFVLNVRFATMADILDRVAILCVRKRGPKPAQSVHAAERIAARSGAR